MCDRKESFLTTSVRPIHNEIRFVTGEFSFDFNSKNNLLLWIHCINIVIVTKPSEHQVQTYIHVHVSDSYFDKYCHFCCLQCEGVTSLCSFSKRILTDLKIS